ncbi:MAG: hypothetical protein IH991_04470 [Planctomycetes bacterium]|nr:hypothetical protein [Planctomycetota bacterium]
MLQSWRSKLREAEAAFKTHRLDKAANLIRAEKLDQYQPGQRLASEVALALANRAETHAERGEVETGWCDLELAQSLVGETERLTEARAVLMQFEFSQLEHLLSADDTQLALNRIDGLRRRGAGMQRLHLLRDVSLKLDEGRNLLRQARFSDADEQLGSAASLLPSLQFIEQRREDYREVAERCRQLTAELHHMLTSGDWSESLVLADQLLEIAPDYTVALDARKRAWEEVGRHSTSSQVEVVEERQLVSNVEVAAVACDAGDAASSQRDVPSRFLMWVDGVGGYLVCLGNTITLGQAVPDNNADIPIQGDLRSQHARIRRDGEAYLLEPIGDLAIGGQAFHETTFLTDGDEIDFAGVRLRFQKPHVLSASARLDFISRHRTFPWCDGILLMAESCVLGPNLHNHVVCRDWPEDVVLFRQDNHLFCRSLERIEIDGKECEGQGEIFIGSRIVGNDFAISLEEVS